MTDASQQDARTRVLIIKMGYGETLDADTDGVVSLGDILRTTVLLHAFPRESHAVTWLVDTKGEALLKGNRNIDRLVTAVRDIPAELRAAPFDVIVNLEKLPRLCRAADSMAANTHFGFRFDAAARETGHHAHAGEALNICWDLEFKHRQGRSWSEVLFRMINRPYRGEGYQLGERKFRPPIHDVGLNHLVGAKFPLKRWPEARWRDLRASLLPTHIVSWQQGTDDLERYIEWIASCRTLVTNDSLGLHIALALRTPTVALFGPTLASEIGDTSELIKLTPAVTCERCAGEACERGRTCIDQISIGAVRGAVLDLLSSRQAERRRGVA